MSILITPAHLAAIASLAVAASKDPVSLSITAIQLTVVQTADILSLDAIATDRYRIARLTSSFTPQSRNNAPAEGLTPAELVALVPASEWIRAAKAITGTKHDRGERYVEISLDSLDATAARALVIDDTRNHTTVVLPLIIGFPYPPVARLIPTDDTTPVGVVALHPGRLADIAKLRSPAQVVHPAGYRNAAMHFSGLPTENPAKPGPVWAHRDEHDLGWNSEIGYMLQPNLLAR